jgi:hypothetical protein
MRMTFLWPWPAYLLRLSGNARVRQTMALLAKEWCCKPNNALVWKAVAGFSKQRLCFPASATVGRKVALPEKLRPLLKNSGTLRTHNARRGGSAYILR